MPKKPKVTPAAKAAPVKKPEWLLETPAMLYTLEASCDPAPRQLIDLTMDEYDALKGYLAELRGIEVPAKEVAHA